MARLCADNTRKVMQSAKLLARTRFRLDDLRYDYPPEPVPPGWKPFAWLHHLVKTAAETRDGTRLPPRVRKLRGNELRLIRRQIDVCYFLTVYYLVRFARAHHQTNTRRTARSR